MIRGALFLLAGLALAACEQGGQTGSNVAAVANAVKPAAAGKCAPPALAMADNAQLESALMDETKANFATAFTRACDKGFLTNKPLIDSKAADQGKLFLINAPEANVASIYLSDVDGSRMVLEYPFLTTDGKSQVPSADELEEAIYCVVRGATPEEQESTGRCLVD
jgi:hypothetical protein